MRGLEDTKRVTGPEPMRVDAFDFELPEALIALEPARPRDSARLLHVARAGALHDHVVRDLPALLHAGDMLVVNDTRVLPAQLRGLRDARAAGGGDAEPVAIDITLHKDETGNDTDNSVWRAFVRPAKRIRTSDQIRLDAGLAATCLAREGAEARLQFNCARGDFLKALTAIGAPPLPPYIARKRAITDQDRDDYQTVYAREAGSVAAPTAGLHFTDDLLARLTEKGVLRETITLHVGAGTFLPVTADETDDHRMHAEWGEITPAQADRINTARARGGRVIAVGTTALRLLESAADASGHLHPFAAETDIFITPGYRFRITDALMTNFHLPRSTLFMLVSAFAGLDEMRRAYQHAIDGGYRFYSYGDASFLERK